MHEIPSAHFPEVILNHGIERYFPANLATSFASRNPSFFCTHHISSLRTALRNAILGFRVF